MSNAESQRESTISEDKQPSFAKKRIIGLLLIILSVSIAWFLLVAYVGWQSGESLQIQRQEEALTEQITHQIDLAATDVAQEKFNLALRRLEWILAREPQNDKALSLQTTAQNSLNILLTPTPVMVLPPTLSPTPLPTEAPADDEDPIEVALQQIRRLIATKEWETAVSAILDFQLAYPNFDRQETNQYLYDAYIELGLDLLEGENIELGLFYIAQAATLGDLSQSVLDYQTWAELYLQGVAFYGANWDASAYYFRDLCLAAPFFQSSCDRLYDVLILYGDQESAALEWCPAEILYDEAILYGSGPELNNKLTQAKEECLLATPTPDLPTETITNTQSITNTNPLPIIILTQQPTLTVTPVP
ncbi:MAG: hypothetical protein GY943_10175 [Chloroflexi bacterium]|nr:hypothetical protein [Chloroflexota bacterium]